MSVKAKVVLTDYVWESLEVEKKILEGIAELSPMQTRTPGEFIAAAADCDALVNDGPGTATDLMTLLREADVVSLHPPLTPQTRKMMNDDAFAAMKSTAFLVNCSRGPVIDTAALVRALDANKIAGCALDTTDPEPLPDPHPLRGRANVIVNPHVAWYSE